MSSFNEGIAPPPPGTTPNFVDPVSNNLQQVIATSITLPIAIIAVVLRLATRVGLVRAVGADDYLIIPALLAAITFVVMKQYAAAHQGAGRHVWDVPAEWLTPFLKGQLGSALVYGLSVTFTKLSVLAFYQRVFSVNRRFKIITWILIVFVAVNMLATGLATVFICTPVHKFWDVTLPYGHCNQINLLAITNGAIFCFTDFAVVLLPVPLLWKLKLPLNQKLLLLCLFATGFLVCAAGLIREIVTAQVQGNPDFTWASNYDLSWYIVETNVAIICACAPPCKPIFGHLSSLQSIRSLRSRFTSDPSYGTSDHTSKHGSGGGSNAVEKGKRGFRKPSTLSTGITSSVVSTDPRLQDGTYMELGDNPRGVKTHTTVQGGKSDEKTADGEYVSAVPSVSETSSTKGLRGDGRIIKSHHVQMDVEYKDVGEQA